MSEDKKRGRGRPTKCTPEITKEIEGYLLEGMWIEHACAIAGITGRCYHNWIDRGEREINRVNALEASDENAMIEESELPFAEFFLSCTRARAMADIELLDGIREAGMGVHRDKEEYRDYKALGWLLERRNPKLFRAQQDNNVTITQKRATPFDPDALSDEALAELERAAIEQTGDDDGFSDE